MIAWSAAALLPVGYRPGRLDLTRYDRSPELTVAERQALTVLLAMHGWGGRTVTLILGQLAGAARLVCPLHEAIAATEGNPYWKERALVALLRACAREERAFWGWDQPVWGRHLTAEAARFLTANQPNEAGATRHYMLAAAYVLGCARDLSVFPAVQWEGVAQKVFGGATIETQVQRVLALLGAWGYAPATCRSLRGVTAEALLRMESPALESITAGCLDNWRREQQTSGGQRADIFLLGRALAHLGILAQPLPALDARPDQYRAARIAHIAPAWVAQVERWEATSTLTRHTRETVRHWLFKVGRWLVLVHPTVTEAAAWTRELAAEAVAAIDGLRVGDYVWNAASLRATMGRPLAPRSKYSAIAALRQFFSDAQEWEWIPKRFDPIRSFRTPRSIRAHLGPNPRTIDDDIWAKLLWAGLNVTAADLPLWRGRIAPDRSDAPVEAGAHDAYYPPVMIQALAVVWLFSGLRSDEIARLRVGCIRWQQHDVAVPGRPGDVLAKDAVCLLDVPNHKTGSPFTKPVDPLLGRAIAAWEAARPAQPPAPDPRTGEVVALLFSNRARPLARNYLNRSLIPILCRKAGVPLADARGRITSHRARSTIASQLYNAKEPMTLVELQAWLGHRSPQSTQHYTRITPITLAKAYTDAGYFARNVRTIAVLLDRDAVQSGAASAGTPWQYFDLGHGYCTYNFFEQCPHRMACARCDFYVPKPSTKAELIEAKGNLQRMLTAIPLTEEERAAVDDGAAAIDRLLERLVDLPTPAGPTPRELGRRGGTPLPVLAHPPDPNASSVPPRGGADR